ncbi:MAG: hypothetical protein LUD81_05960 [Clostridiales bacterium]|nr:hypothetical protein [Clostridiales bacterium]
MSSEKIAEKLNITPGNVRISSMRALKKLNEILTEKGFVWEDIK